MVRSSEFSEKWNQNFKVKSLLLFFSQYQHKANVVAFFSQSKHFLSLNVNLLHEIQE